MGKRTKKDFTVGISDCIACGSACCQYIVVDLPNEPRSERRFEEILWYLLNPHTKILKEGRQWSLLVTGRCRMLAADGRCRIYRNRPFICADYPQVTKEECHGPHLRNFSGRIFHSAEELLTYLAEERGKKWAKKWLEHLTMAFLCR